MAGNEHGNHPSWVRFRVRHRSAHVEHRNTPNVGAFSHSTLFHTCRAQKPPDLGVFSCSTLFDAVLHSSSMETHPSWVWFRGQCRSARFEHGNHPMWVGFRGQGVSQMSSTDERRVLHGKVGGMSV